LEWAKFSRRVGRKRRLFLYATSRILYRDQEDVNTGIIAFHASRISFTQYVAKLFFQTFLSTLFFSFRKRKEKRDQKKRKGDFTFFFSFVQSFLFFLRKEKIGRKVPS
jgi:hypothetical protein